MNNLKLYRMDDRYIRYLHRVDNKVQYNKNARRPYVGVVFTFGKFQYFVPMESPKPNHAKIKSGKHILKLQNGAYGMLGFNNMIPAHPDALISFDIAEDPDVKYRSLLQHQIELCNRMKADILNHAQATYFDVTEGSNKFLVSISCNFKKLENACKRFDINHGQRQ